MGMWFTDATIAFVKEILADLEELDNENAKIEQKILNYGRRLKQFSTFRSVTVENSPDELFYKNVYVGIEPDEVMPKSVLLDEAIEILTKKVDELREQLELGKQQEKLKTELFNKLTKDYYPGILDEILN